MHISGSYMALQLSNYSFRILHSNPKLCCSLSLELQTCYLKVYPYMLFIDEHNYYIYRLFLWKLKQVVAEKPISEAKGESAILQESIIKEVNENVKVDGKLHSTLSSRTSQFLNLRACSELSPQERAILRASLF